MQHRYLHPGVVFLILLSVSLSATANEGPLIQNETHVQDYPSADGDIVVWEERDDTRDSSIIAMNLKTGEVFPVCSAPGLQYSPDISGSTVVWQDKRYGNWDIFGYNITTGEEFPVCTDPERQTRPRVSGKYVVWTDERDGEPDIRGYDREEKREVEICVRDEIQWHPDIAGDIVIWEDWRAGVINCGDIWGYNLSSKTEFLIRVNYHSDWAPVIDNKTVVWQTFNPPFQFDIAMASLTNGTEEIVYSAPGRQWASSITNDTVIWIDEEEPGRNIRVMNLTTGQNSSLTADTAFRTWPVITGDKALWVDFRDRKSMIWQKPIVPAGS